MNRYQTYRRLMTDRDHWQKTFAVISCKIIREKQEFKREFNVLLDNLTDPALRKLVKQRDWRLVFTGGTYRSLPDHVLNCPELKGRLFVLAPSAAGIIQIANLVVYGQLFGIAFFNHMEDLYADSPQNLCLRRICNYYGTPLFEDASSIQFILERWKGGLEAPSTREQFPAQEIAAYYGSGQSNDEVLYREDLSHDSRRDRSRETIAIVSHDMQKMTMLNFCLEHISRILSFRRVISTGTTGAFLAEHFRVALEAFGKRVRREEIERWGWDRNREDAKTFLARKIQPMASGPKGGDVQISAKVIDGTCHRVLFFQDPQSAHPHQFDIRLMEKAVQDPETAVLFASSARTAKVFV
jgi:methylglyoxal synthase